MEKFYSYYSGLEAEELHYKSEFISLLSFDTPFLWGLRSSSEIGTQEMKLGTFHE